MNTYDAIGENANGDKCFLEHKTAPKITLDKGRIKMDTFTGSQPTALIQTSKKVAPGRTLKRISNNIKYHTVKNLKEKLISHLFTSQPYELGKLLVTYDLKVSHYTS